MDQHNNGENEKHKVGRYRLLGLVRFFMGFIFFWGFLDKLFGLGFATPVSQGWLAGKSPTYGFLAKATKGPFVSLFHAMAGSALVDWLFMLGLCGIGLALLLGIGVRVASYSGFLLMILMWSALLPPQNNPVIDEHIIYATLFLLFLQAHPGYSFGFGRMWSKTALVQKYPIFE